MLDLKIIGIEPKTKEYLFGINGKTDFDGYSYEVEFNINGDKVGIQVDDNTTIKELIEYANRLYKGIKDENTK